MKDKKLQEVVTIEEGKKPPMEIIHEGPTQPEERVQFSDKLEEIEEEAEDDEIKPEINSGFFLKKSQKYIKEALKQAQLALEQDEVPVGAVIVKGDQILARDHNRREQLKDVLAHAEILTIQEAQKKLKSWHLKDCEIYITAEPCPMCLGAILQSGIKKVVYGCDEPNFGAIESKVNLARAYKPSLEIISGVYEDECSGLMSKYFKGKRNKFKK